MHKIPVPLPTSSTTLFLNRCLLWYIESRYVNVRTSSFSISCSCSNTEFNYYSILLYNLAKTLGCWYSSASCTAFTSEVHNFFQTRATKHRHGLFPANMNLNIILVTELYLYGILGSLPNNIVTDSINSSKSHLDKFLFCIWLQSAATYFQNY